MSNKKNKSVRVNKVTLTHAKQPTKVFFVPGESATQVQRTLEEKLPHHAVTVTPQGRGRVELELYPNSYNINDVAFIIERDGEIVASFSEDDLRNTNNNVTRAVKKASLDFLQDTCAKPLSKLEKELETERQNSPHPEDHPEWFED